MAKPYKVELTEQERSDLLVLTRKGKASARRIKHALVLLRSDEGATDEQVVAGVATVERIRKRFVEEGLEAALSEKPRPPPPKLTGKAEALLLALACSDVPDGRARWSMQMLADRLVELGAMDLISDETVRRTPKKARPSRGTASRLIPEITAEFVWRMEDVLDLYAEPSDPKRLRVAFDEMPLQLLSEVRAPLLARPARFNLQPMVPGGR